MGNTERFTGRVEAYERYRAGYPAEALIGWMRQVCGLEAGWRVADVAAGTGLLTEVLVGNGNAVVAVEPNAEMRAVLEARFGGARVVDGTAEATGLEAGSAEMVTAGRAFHWFEPVGAAAEFRRVLVPGGWVVIVSSGPEREPSERGAAFEAIEREYGTDAAHVQSRGERGERIRQWLAGFGGVPVRAEFRTERWLGREEFMGAVQSTSVAPLPGDARYAEMQRALAEFFARWSAGGRLRMDEVCRVDAVRVSTVPNVPF